MQNKVICVWKWKDISLQPHWCTHTHKQTNKQTHNHLMFMRLYRAFLLSGSFFWFAVENGFSILVITRRASIRTQTHTHTFATIFSFRSTCSTHFVPPFLEKYLLFSAKKSYLLPSAAAVVIKAWKFLEIFYSDNKLCCCHLLLWMFGGRFWRRFCGRLRKPRNEEHRKLRF